MDIKGLVPFGVGLVFHHSGAITVFFCLFLERMRRENKNNHKKNHHNCKNHHKENK